MVAATVRPAHGRTIPVVAPKAEPEPEPPPRPRPPPKFKRGAKAAEPAPEPATGAKPKPRIAPEDIEPGRYRRIARNREPVEQRLDLHGLDQDQARAALHGFIARAHDQGARAVLVITGKGGRGDGVLRRRTPEWLAEAPSRAKVAGVSQADRRHGGEGALYVALKRAGR